MMKLNEPKFSVQQVIYYLFENRIHDDRVDRIIMADGEYQEEHAYLLKSSRRMVYENDLFERHKDAKRALINKFKRK